MKEGLKIAREELGDDKFFKSILEINDIVITSSTLVHLNDFWGLPQAAVALIDQLLKHNNPEYARAVIESMSMLGVPISVREKLQRLASETEDTHKIYWLLNYGNFCYNLPEDIADRMFGHIVEHGGSYYANYLLQEHGYAILPEKYRVALRNCLNEARENRIRTEREEYLQRLGRV